MIRGVYRKDEERHFLELTGHADYAGYGQDIVCAGASALVCALLGWLENNPQELWYSDADVHSGHVRLICEGGAETAAVFAMTAMGLLQLADAYRDHVEMEIHGFCQDAERENREHE